MLSSAWKEHLLEACLVCLFRHNHFSNLGFKVKGDQEIDFTLVWNSNFTHEMDNSWKEQDDATERGAECLSILLVQELTKYTIIERSVKTTGFDYWLGESNGILFQKKARLEISGIFKGNESKVNQRVKIKLEQVKQSNNLNIPAFVSVIEFSLPMGKFVSK